MTTSAFTFRTGADPFENERLWRNVSPIERSAIGLGKKRFLRFAEGASASYVVEIDGMLGGIAYVVDLEDRRAMCFVKTKYLTTARKVTYARNIPLLFKEIATRERARLGAEDARPLYFTIDADDAHSREWFLRAGCVMDENGLKCPEEV